MNSKNLRKLNLKVGLIKFSLKINIICHGLKHYLPFDYIRGGSTSELYVLIYPPMLISLKGQPNSTGVTDWIAEA